MTMLLKSTVVEVYLVYKSILNEQKTFNSIQVKNNYLLIYAKDVQKIIYSE